MTPQAAPEKPLSEPARLAGVIVDPVKTFHDIAMNPRRWWIPMILMMVTSFAFIWCFSQRVGWDKMMRDTLESNSRMQQIPPEQREQAIQRAIKVAGTTSYVGAVLGGPIIIFVVAGMLMLVMNGLIGTQVRYLQSVAIVAYSMLPGVIAGLLSVVVMYLKSPEDFDIRNPLAFNGAAFLNMSTAPKWQTALASSFDLFTFWTLALLATGYAATTRKLAWSKTFTAVVLMWIVWVVVKTGWAGLAS